MSHSMKYKRLAKKLGVKDGKPGDLLNRMHSLKGMPKKHHKNWIANAIKKPGALHRQLGVKAGSKIPKSKLNAAVKKGGLEGKRANLAKTLAGFHHKEPDFKKHKMACKENHKHSKTCM